MCNKAFILVFLTYITLEAHGFVSPITKCKWDDPKCIRENAQKMIPLFGDGIPELNVETLDPLHLKHIDASTSNLKLIVSDVTMTGLKNCVAKKMERDIEKSIIIVQTECTCDFDGKYEMKGQLFVLPIEGKGDLHAKIRKMIVNAEINLADKIGKDGKKHWNVKSFKHSFELKDKSDVKFENLFPDNELLRTTTNELIETNGNDVITEIGAPILHVVITKVVENAKRFFAALPVEDIALD